MLARNMLAESAADSLTVRDGQRREALRREPSTHGLIVLDSRLEIDRPVQGRNQTSRLSPRRSLAVIVGLSAALWLAVAALVF